MSRLNEYNITKMNNLFSYLLQFILLLLLIVISINQVLGQESPNTWQCVKYYPQNNEQNINPDTQLKLIFPTPPTLGMSGIIYIYEASSNTLIDSIDMSIPPGPKNSRTPAPYDKMVYKNDPWDPANGYTRANPPPVLPPLESQYQRKYIGGTKESDVYHFYPVLIDENTAIITLHQQLEYDKTYYVRVDKGIFSYMGKDSLMITHDHEWKFSTKKSSPALEVNQFVVAADGSGDFNTIQGALEFIPDNHSSKMRLLIKNGTYYEIIYVRNKKNVIILGENRDSVIIAYPNNGFLNARPTTGSREEMISKFRNRRSIFALDNCNDILLINLTIFSIGDAPAQNEGLLIKGDRNIVFNVTIVGSGDALQANGNIYIENSSIKGFGDNVLGHGAVFFKNCDFISTYGPHLWVRNSKENHGNVLLNCTLRTVGNIETVIARAPGSQNYSFPYAEAVLINCKLHGIRPEGWGQVGPDKSNLRYWEYNSRSLTDESPIDVSQRVSYSKQLTLKNDSLTIANYSNPSYILDGWIPSFAPIIIRQPNAKTAKVGENVEFSIEVASIPDPVYQWYKDGVAIKDAQSPILKIDDVCLQNMGDYWVQVNNDYGINTSKKVSLKVL